MTPVDFQKPSGWDSRLGHTRTKPLEDRVRDELAARRSHRLGRCPACGTNVVSDDDYASAYGFIFHARCVGDKAPV